MGTGDLGVTDAELLNAMKDWREEDRIAAMSRLKEMVEDPPKVFYCKRGRVCDGKPHGPYTYNHARGDQWPPLGDWFVWAMISGRGAGKTRSGTEWLRKKSRKVPRMAAIAQTTRDMRAVMVEGESGLIRVCENAKIGYEWKPTNREFTFDNGAKVYFYTGEEPDSLRGPQHGLAWLDEPAHMPLIEDVWNNLLMGLRLGEDPRVLVTTTPLPTPWMKTLVKLKTTSVVRVSTYANLDNLAPTYRDQIISQYEGTRLGLQELHGEIIEDVEGALWNGDLIDLAHSLPNGLKYEEIAKRAPFQRIVVGVDPAGTATKRSDETGIIVVGVLDGTFYVLDDLSGRYTPDVWAKEVVRAFNKWSADRVVAEKNYGGDMVEANLRNQSQNLPITIVNSRRGKEIRAEPIVGLYEQGRVKHVKQFAELETQMLEWVPGRGSSPDRVDALVHAVTNLSGRGGPATAAAPVNMPIPTSIGGGLPFKNGGVTLPGGYRNRLIGL